jgi:hypothetical protein
MTLKMETLRTTETSVTTFPMTQSHIPVDSNLGLSSNKDVTIFLFTSPAFRMPLQTAVQFLGEYLILG